MTHSDPDPASLDTLARRSLERCDALAACSSEPTRLARACLTDAMAEAHGVVEGWMRAAGMDVRGDAVGNLIGRIGPADGPTLVLGSHLDTVGDAGRYDGILGVLLALAAVEHVGDSLPVAIEVVGFTGEEAARFPLPYLGSRAYVGALPSEAAQARDPDGVSLAEAVQAWGRDPKDLSHASLGRDTEVIGFLETHIEQGPVLEASDAPVGVVTALVGQCWLRLRFVGQAGHAGTTPMGMRRDPVPAIASLTLEVERLAAATEGLVATVGSVETRPGCVNVIAGEATMTLDLRHPSDEALDVAIAHVLDVADRLAADRGLRLDRDVLVREAAVGCDPTLRQVLRDATAAAGVAVVELPSGAGHDARILSRVAPVAMLFIRTPSGLSHHPLETVIADDVRIALEILVDAVRRVASAVPPRR